MTKHGIVFVEIDVTEDRDAYDYVRSLGYLQAPVVVAGHQTWAGYRPDKIAALATSAA